MFISNCINQDQGRAKDGMIHLPKRGRGSNPRGVYFFHNLKKVKAVSFLDDGQTFERYKMRNTEPTFHLSLAVLEIIVATVCSLTANRNLLIHADLEYQNGM